MPLGLNCRSLRYSNVDIFVFNCIYEPTWSKNATRINIKPGVVYPRVVYYRILIRGLPSSFGELRSNRYIVLPNHLYRPRAADDQMHIYLSRYIIDRIYVSCLFCNRCCLLVLKKLRNYYHYTFMLLCE